MFDKDRYLTRGISIQIPLEIQIMMWSMIEGLNVKKDYLQVFEIKPIKNNLLKIEHRQEVPNYKKEVVITNTGVNSKVKIFVIDDGEHSTMMLSSEY
ncbi:hypothetical protein C4R89_12385 [Clostridioides difficile]|nr:DUF960 domain-containing protein [Clostridioides difficile]MDB0440330.1 hypothetical protein [Clostridioides difficile]